MVEIRGYTEDDVDLLTAEFTKVVQEALVRVCTSVANNLTVATVASAQKFHMPGHHDQHSHGRKGVEGDAALASPSINVAGVSQTYSTDAELADAGVTRDELTALRKYQGKMYGDINKYHRKGSEAMGPERVEQINAVSAQMDGVLARSTLKEDIVVYRGAGSDEWLPKGNLEGSEFIDRGYVSTTANRVVIDNFADDIGGTPLVMKVRAPAGAHAFTLSDMSDEAEIVFARNTRFRITKDAGIFEGERVLEVEVVG